MLPGRTNAQVWHSVIFSNLNRQPNAEDNLSSPVVTCSMQQSSIGLGWVEMACENSILFLEVTGDDTSW